MAKQVLLGQITKRINSTARAFQGTANEHQILLKEKTSRQKPVLRLKGTPMQKYNWMKYNDDYYWVDDIVEDTTETFWVYAHRDPLATFANDIVNKQYYVKYGTSGINPYLAGVDDDRVSPNANGAYTTSLDMTTLVGPASGFNKYGTFVIGTWMWAPGSNAPHSLVYYALDIDGWKVFLREFGSYLNTTFSNLSDVQDVFYNLTNSFGGAGSWSDNIVSCIYVPMSLSVFPGDATTEIFIGGSTASNSSLSGHVKQWAGQQFAQKRYSHIPVDWPSSHFTGGNYYSHPEYRVFNLPKFTVASLITPSEVIDIDLSTLAAANLNNYELTVDYSFSFNTAEYMIRIYDHSTGALNLLGQTSGTLGVNMMQYISPNQNGISTMANAMNKGSAIAFKAISAGTQFGQYNDTVVNEVSTDASVKEEITGIKAEQTKETESKGFKIPIGICSNPLGGSVPPSAVVGTSPYGFASLINWPSANDGTLTNVFRLVITTLMPRLGADNNSFVDGYGEFCKKFGHPIENYVKIPSNIMEFTVPQFAQTVGASVQATGATAAELAQINSLLNGTGVYFETADST